MGFVVSMESCPHAFSKIACGVGQHKGIIDNMQGIEFENDNSPQHVFEEQKQPLMVRLLLKLGVKDSAMANYVLLGIVSVIVVVIMIIGSISGTNQLNQNINIPQGVMEPGGAIPPFLLRQ